MRFCAIVVTAGMLLFAACNKENREVSDGARPTSSSSQIGKPAAPSHAGAAATEDGNEAPEHVSGGHVSSANSQHQVTDAEASAVVDSHHVDAGHGKAHHGGHHEVTTALKIGEKVPDFEVTIDGQVWKLSQLQGDKELTKDGILVLTFWCSFCHSCRHMEHELDDLARQHRGEVGVIALDASAGETTANVAEFAAQQGLTLPIALNADSSTADLFGVRATTTTIIIDGQGVLRYRGQFREGEHKLAEDALRAVLAGEEIPVPETRQKG
jgi:thiol-disulfide isomerase/thioredoxin